ncbi:unnamed protein product, partial [Leptidea sinapis]
MVIKYHINHMPELITRIIHRPMHLQHMDRHPLEDMPLKTCHMLHQLIRTMHTIKAFHHNNKLNCIWHKHIWLKPEIKLEPSDSQKRQHQENEMMSGDLDQPKIKIKTDIFKPDDIALRVDDKPNDAIIKPQDIQKSSEHIIISKENNNLAALIQTDQPKKRGRPKGSTNKPKPSFPPLGGAGPVSTPPVRPPSVGPRPTPPGRPRAPAYQYNVRPFRKDFSGIQFRRYVYFGDVPVPLSVLYNYYDANAEREKLATQAAQIAAQKAAAAKLAAAKLKGVVSGEVTTVDSSSDDESSGSSGSGIKRGPGRPKGSKNTAVPKTPSTPGRRGRPPVPPELRGPGITDMKKFCKAAGIRFDYKKLVEGCTKNKERVAKMQKLLDEAGVEGTPTLEKCRAIKLAKMEKKEQEKQAKREAKTKRSEGTRRMTRGATGVKPRQRIVISSDEEDGTPAARRTLSKLRSSVNDESDS